MRSSVWYAALLAIASLTGCELLTDPDQTTEVTGVVWNASAGEPLVGISLTLTEAAGWGLHPVRDRATTDAAGRFYLAYNPGPREGILDVHANHDPYDPRYQNPWFSVRTGRRHERRIDVYAYTRLTVTARPDSTLGPVEGYMLHLPCVGGPSPLTTPCARGNGYTEVLASVYRNGQTRWVADSVYTPIGVETAFEMRF